MQEEAVSAWNSLYSKTFVAKAVIDISFTGYMVQKVLKTIRADLYTQFNFSSKSPMATRGMGSFHRPMPSVT